MKHICLKYINLSKRSLFTPQYSWNIAKVGVKHQSINPKEAQFLYWLNFWCRTWLVNFNLFILFIIEPEWMIELKNNIELILAL
jgi:hypothetical protein